MRDREVLHELLDKFVNLKQVALDAIGICCKFDLGWRRVVHWGISCDLVL